MTTRNGQTDRSALHVSAATGANTSSAVTLKSPAATIPVSLPWMTGNPYALYARARGISPAGKEGRWSAPSGWKSASP